jgi:hypothetical protein
MEYALDGQAILFVGSGFSDGAINLSGGFLRSGSVFAKHLSKQLDLSDDTNLEDAAEEFAERFGDQQLINLLHNEFTASDIASHHLEIAQIP